MTTWDFYNYKEFYVQLIDNTDKTIIHESHLGFMNKHGRQLNLYEAHSLVCTVEKHRELTTHDPCNDTKLTRCIFNKILSRMSPNELQM